MQFILGKMVNVYILPYLINYNKKTLKQIIEKDTSKE